MPPKTRKKLAPVTPTRLYESALFYLERYAASAFSVRQVLRRKLTRAVMEGQDLDIPALHTEIETIIARLISSGVINEDRLAAGKAVSLRRKGGSRRMIEQKLSQKGIAPHQITAALEEADQDAPAGDAERAAALKLAARRRLGPFRPPEMREAFKAKDLATLARAGFAFDIAKAVIGWDGEETEDMFV
jgi:regulatory protein